MRIIQSERWGGLLVAAGDGHHSLRVMAIAAYGLLVFEVEHRCKKCAVDSFELSACRSFECVGGDAVDITESSVGSLVQQGEGIAVEGVVVVGSAGLV
jgi:hypothetical protein